MRKPSTPSADRATLATLAEIDHLDAVLEGTRDTLPPRLRDLVLLAREVTAAFADEALDAPGRSRIRARVGALRRRQRVRRLLALSPVHRAPVVVAGGGAAAVGAAVLGLALLRRPHSQPAA